MQISPESAYYCGLRSELRKLSVHCLWFIRFVLNLKLCVVQAKEFSAIAT